MGEDTWVILGLGAGGRLGKILKAWFSDKKWCQYFTPIATFIMIYPRLNFQWDRNVSSSLNVQPGWFIFGRPNWEPNCACLSHDMSRYPAPRSFESAKHAFFADVLYRLYHDIFQALPWPCRCPFPTSRWIDRFSNYVFQNQAGKVLSNQPFPCFHILVHLIFQAFLGSRWSPSTWQKSTQQVVFQPQNVMTMARAGQPLSEVASQADVFIRALDDLTLVLGKHGEKPLDIGQSWIPNN